MTRNRPFVLAHTGEPVLGQPVELVAREQNDLVFLSDVSLEIEFERGETELDFGQLGSILRRQLHTRPSIVAEHEFKESRLRTLQDRLRR